jgi:peptidoglycan hydrolase FlgJ
VGVNSLEYKQGVAQQEHSEFRHYENYLHSFSDYVNFMKSNPRYQQALDVGSDSTRYANALQTAGYATDPGYAEKIKQLLTSDLIRIAASTNSTNKLPVINVNEPSQLNKG